MAKLIKAYLIDTETLYIFFSGKKVLNLSYEDKLQLVAYYKQISCGSYDNSKMPETGYFDVVGNDRRYIQHQFCCNDCQYH